MRPTQPNAAVLESLGMGAADPCWLDKIKQYECHLLRCLRACASRNAVLTSSVSIASRLPPGKHTSPAGRMDFHSEKWASMLWPPDLPLA
jgi:hypothetical protein